MFSSVCLEAKAKGQTPSTISSLSHLVSGHPISPVVVASAVAAATLARGCVVPLVALQTGAFLLKAGDSTGRSHPLVRFQSDWQSGGLAAAGGVREAAASVVPAAEGRTAKPAVALAEAPLEELCVAVRSAASMHAVVSD